MKGLYQDRLVSIQKHMTSSGVSVLLLPRTDIHRNEYICEEDNNIQWLTGFAGSYAFMVLTPDKAYLWTDGRYSIETKEYFLGTFIEVFIEGAKDVDNYKTIAIKLIKDEETLAYDASLFSYNETIGIVSALKNNKRNVKINHFYNPFARLKQEKPIDVSGSLFLLEEQYQGLSVQQKVKHIRKNMLDRKVDYMLIADLDELAWLTNCRGYDIPYNPVFKSFAIVSQESFKLYLHIHQCSDVENYFIQDNIKICSYNTFLEDVRQILSGKVWFDGERINAHIIKSLQKDVEIYNERLPIRKLKAVKNETELNGIRQAMIKDGIVWVKMWHWLEQKLLEKEIITEQDIEKKLTTLKQVQEGYVCESFRSIVAYADNAALCHYSNQHNTMIKDKGMLLIDTGTHYKCGTTDTTRMIALGNLTSEEKRNATLVLKGNIALTQTRFKKGTKGHQLDAIARQYLWAEGLDYAHGTGHGIGYCLSVHEGYASISTKVNENPLEPGMIMSIEPGVYMEGSYGIRIENAVVVEASTAMSGYFYFSTLTLCPIDTRCVDSEMLTDVEKNWLNDYHKKVFDSLSSLLNTDEIAWLKEKTRAI